MKHALSFVALFFLLIVFSNAQERNEKTISDSKEQLLADLNTRFSGTKNGVIVWDNSSYGYEAFYTINSIKYLTRYDKKGKYIETLQQGEWNANVPPIIKNSYDKDLRNTYLIEKYWEVNDPGRKGYYLELRSKQGQPKEIWLDDKGNIFDSPVYK